jgi:hypothetical protein
MISAGRRQNGFAPEQAAPLRRPHAPCAGVPIPVERFTFAAKNLAELGRHIDVGSERQRHPL